MKSLWMTLLLIGGLLAPRTLLAEGAFHCEVLAVQGSVQVRTSNGDAMTVKEGDLLSEGDSVEVPDSGSLDLAYDKEWSNVVRLEGGSNAKISSISPAQLDLSQGAVYAKLKSLPNKTSFEIKTPTAVAAVRGTEYRTLVQDGQTQVFNFSPSKVFVYGVDPMGVKMLTPAVLEQDQKTQIEAKGDVPASPVDMNMEEKSTCEKSQKAIESGVERAVSSGRTGKIQTVAEIEQAVVSPSKSAARYDEESRVTDTRRRSFK